MTLEITMENLKESVKALRNLAKQIEQFPHDVAEESKTRVGYSNMSHESEPGLNVVIAGGEGVAFKEYGAGFYAEETTIPLEGGGEMPNYPGVWSEDPVLGKQTFQHYLERDGSPDGYPYNRMPQMRMQDEAERLRNETENKAKGYFS